MAIKEPDWTPLPPIKNHSKPTPRFAHKISTGTRMLPALPYEHWMDAQGNSVHFVVGTTRDYMNPEIPKTAKEQYGQVERDRVTRQGWIPLKYEQAKKYMMLLSADSPVYQGFARCKNQADWDAFCEAEAKHRQGTAAATTEEIKKRQPDYMTALNQQKTIESIHDLTDEIRKDREERKADKAKK